MGVRAEPHESFTAAGKPAIRRMPQRARIIGCRDGATMAEICGLPLSYHQGAQSPAVR